MKKKYAPYLSILFLLFVWQITAKIIDLPMFFPAIDDLVVSFAALLSSASFYLSLGATLIRGVIGILISFLIAAGLSLVFARIDWLYELFRPILAVMRSVPVISFILLALIFLHAESIPLLIGFLTMFPLLTENLTKGMAGMRPELTILSQQFRFSRRNHFCQIIYPQIKPFLYSGLASAAGFGWRAIIMGEVLSQCTLGIGSEMKRAQTFIALSDLIAWTLIAILIGFLTDKIVRRLGEYTFPVAFLSEKRENNISDCMENRPKGLPIALKNVSYLYGVSHFSCSFEAGKVYGISAPSGTGKTTLLHLINGTLKPVSGTVSIDRHFGIASLFQEPELLPHLSVQENITIASARFCSREKACAKAEELLLLVEMEEYKEQFPHQLSYGQQQRIALARALIYPSPFLFLDEPFKGMDAALTQRIIHRIREKESVWQQTLLFTSHQREELTALADEVITL